MKVCRISLRLNSGENETFVFIGRKRSAVTSTEHADKKSSCKQAVIHGIQLENKSDDYDSVHF